MRNSKTVDEWFVPAMLLFVAAMVLLATPRAGRIVNLGRLGNIAAFGSGNWLQSKYMIRKNKMNKKRMNTKILMIPLALALLIITGPFVSQLAYADEGGVSFWLPGQYGSLAAVPAEPGWSVPLVYYHASSDAGRSKEFAIGGRITAGLDVDTDLLLAIPTYVFADPVFGGQARSAWLESTDVRKSM